MFYVLSWLVVVALLGIWSLAIWALRDVPDWMLANAAALQPTASDGTAIAVPDWLTPWVPPAFAQWESQLVAALTPFVDGLLQIAPTLADGLTVVMWLIWGVGSLLLVLLGIVLHLLIATLRRRGGVDSARPRSMVSARQLDFLRTETTQASRTDAS